MSRLHTAITRLSSEVQSKWYRVIFARTLTCAQHETSDIQESYSGQNLRILRVLIFLMPSSRAPASILRKPMTFSTSLRQLILRWSSSPHHRESVRTRQKVTSQCLTPKSRAVMICPRCSDDILKSRTMSFSTSRHVMFIENGKEFHIWSDITYHILSNGREWKLAVKEQNCWHDLYLRSIEFVFEVWKKTTNVIDSIIFVRTSDQYKMLRTPSHLCDCEQIFELLDPTRR